MGFGDHCHRCAEADRLERIANGTEQAAGPSARVARCKRIGLKKPNCGFEKKKPQELLAMVAALRLPMVGKTRKRKERHTTADVSSAKEELT